MKHMWTEVQTKGAGDVFRRYWRQGVVRVGGELVGTDDAGNKYFENQSYKLEPLQRRYRWVEYAAEVYDPSQVPAEWHGWLHYTNDIVPGTPEADELVPRYRRAHLPNQTGTANAYSPDFVGERWHRERASIDNDVRVIVANKDSN
jgi:NADH:ubiquinone oxidoreductase subunit